MTLKVSWVLRATLCEGHYRCELLCLGPFDSAWDVSADRKEKNHAHTVDLEKI